MAQGTTTTTTKSDDAKLIAELATQIFSQQSCRLKFGKPLNVDLDEIILMSVECASRIVARSKVVAT